MLVSELIEFLKTQDQNLEVIYACYSEYNTLTVDQIKTIQAHPARNDGWVHTYPNYYKNEPSTAQVTYLAFPGN